MKVRLGLVFLLAGGLLFLAACGGSKGPSKTAGSQDEEEAQPAATFTLTSSAFKYGDRIPDRYTCRGENLSPPLAWQGVPAGTKSLALIVEDPDAPGGTFIHWLIYNLPATLTGLPEGVPTTEQLDNGARQGINDFHAIGYRGPCPPPGKPHRYFFILQALDEELALDAGATIEQLEKETKGHVLKEAKLMGIYSR